MKLYFITIVFLKVVLSLMLISCSSQGITAIRTETVTTTVTTVVKKQTITLDASVIYDIETTLESIYENTNPSLVYIEVSYSRGGASGSGFVWDIQGNIVTSNHIVDGARSITVIFHNDIVAEASLVGQDVDSDLAVIKVDVNTEHLHPVTIGDSTNLKIGQLAIAIGNPYGFQGTMTVGFISGLGRFLPVYDSITRPSYNIPDVIQTDAAVNPGNSGGVLLNANGNLIGMTSTIVSESGGSAGVGFAIPSVIVEKVVPSLISEGHYEHPYLGTHLISLTPEIARAANLSPSQRGALIQSIDQGSPADKAGLKAGNSQISINNGQVLTIGGDIIVRYDDLVVDGGDDLVTYLARFGCVGKTADLTLIRDGREIRLQVVIGARPD